MKFSHSTGASLIGFLFFLLSANPTPNFSKLDGYCNGAGISLVLQGLNTMFASSTKMFNRWAILEIFLTLFQATLAFRSPDQTCHLYPYRSRFPRNVVISNIVMNPGDGLRASRGQWLLLPMREGAKRQVRGGCLGRSQEDTRLAK